MAQQIQFIYLTQSDYDNLTPQTSKIYFTSDTHRIYKGSDLYAATTFDQLNFNSIEASSITVDGDPVSVEGHTHSMSDIEDLDIPEGIWESGEETDSARRIITESTPVVTGSGSTVISQGALTTGVANVAGLKGYRYINTGNVTNSLTFATAPTGWATGDVVSIVNDSKYPECATIASISGTTVTFSENLPFDTIVEDDGWDAKLVYVSEKPTVGDVEIGYGAYAEGLGTKALNVASHAEGMGTKALGHFSHTEGRETTAQYCGHAEGRGTQALGLYAHAEGQTTKAYGNKSHAEGTQSETYANNSHAEGYAGKIMDGAAAHIEGYGNVLDINQETEVTTTTATGQSIGGHVEGLSNKGAGIAVHVEGRGNVGNAEAVHVEGYNNIASGKAAHAEGNRTRAGSLEKPTEDVTSTEGIYTHAEGNSTLAKGSASHAEGAGTQALGRATHAEGRHAVALGNYAHAEGFDTFAGVPTTSVPRPTTTNSTSEGFFAHAEGHHTLAQGNSSHAEGKETITQNQSEHAQGQFNKSNKVNATFGNAGNTIHSIGIGTTESTRKNAVEVMQNGKVFIKDAGGYDGTNPTGSGVKDIATILSTVASSTHTHPELSGITQSTITKDTGTFTNLVVASASFTATNVETEEISASTATFGDINVNGTASTSNLVAGSGSFTNLTVGGSNVSVEGHTHVMSEITDLDTTSFASSNHTHPELSGLTSSSITKDTGTFTNLVVTNASLDATSITASGVEVNGGIQASTVSASSATFQTLTVTGEVTMSLSSVDFQNINASSLTVNGSAVSLEGHSHSASEISGLDAAISAATSSFALTGHTHDISDITSLATKVSGLTSSKVEKTNGVFTNLSTTNLVVSSATIDALSIEASSMTVNGTGTFNAISASTATFGDINVTGTASLNATHVSASTLTADSGTFTNLTVVSASFEATSIEASTIATSSITVGGSAVALVGHTHPASEVTGLQSVLDGLSSTYASVSHGHAISDITNLSTILTGITESDIEKDTVTADIGNFRLLSVSGSANFSVNNVSANAVTVNGTNVALVGHSHSVADIDGLSTALNGFASSGHTHGELTGITQTSISKANANFTTVSASAGTFNTITTSDLNLTNMSISSAAVSSMTVTNLNVTNTLKLNNKDIATQEYVQAMISQAIGQILASAY